MEINIRQDDLEITIKGKSEHFFGEDLHTKAVITLIQEADVHGWEKHNQGHQIL